MTDIENHLLPKIHFFEFDTNKSTYAEIQTFLKAIDTLKKDSSKKGIAIKVFSDCENLGKLLGPRKEKLIKNDFKKKSGAPLPHGLLYKHLYQMIEGLDLEFIKIKGHASFKKRETLEEKLFAIVDKRCRERLRELVKNLDI